MRLGRPPPDPGVGVAIEVLGSGPSDEGDVMVIGQRLPGERCAPEDPPPARNQIEPGRAHWNEGLLDTGMRLQPLPDGTTGVARQVVRDEIEFAGRIGAIQRLQELQIAAGVARGSRLGERLTVADPQCP